MVNEPLHLPVLGLISVRYLAADLACVVLNSVSCLHFSQVIMYLPIPLLLVWLLPTESVPGLPHILGLVIIVAFFSLIYIC